MASVVLKGVGKEFVALVESQELAIEVIKGAMKLLSLDSVILDFRVGNEIAKVSYDPALHAVELTEVPPPSFSLIRAEGGQVFSVSIVDVEGARCATEFFIVNYNKI